MSDNLNLRSARALATSILSGCCLMVGMVLGFAAAVALAAWSGW